MINSDLQNGTEAQEMKIKILETECDSIEIMISFDCRYRQRVCKRKRLRRRRPMTAESKSA